MLVTEQRPAAAADAVHHGRGERPDHERGHHHTANVCAGDDHSPEHFNHQIRAIHRSWGARTGPVTSAARVFGRAVEVAGIAAAVGVLRAGESVAGSRAPASSG